MDRGAHLVDQLAEHGVVGSLAYAGVTVQRAAEPLGPLHEDRLIEAEALFLRRKDRRRVLEVAELQQRIERDPQSPEGQERRDEENRDGVEDASRNVREHWRFSAA